MLFFLSYAKVFVPLPQKLLTTHNNEKNYNSLQRIGIHTSWMHGINTDDG